MKCKYFEEHGKHYIIVIKYHRDEQGKVIGKDFECMYCGKKFSKIEPNHWTSKVVEPSKVTAAITSALKKEFQVYGIYPIHKEKKTDILIVFNKERD